MERIQHHNQIMFAKNRDRFENEISEQKRIRYNYYSKQARLFNQAQKSWNEKNRQEDEHHNGSRWKDDDSKRDKRSVRRCFAMKRCWFIDSNSLYGAYYP